MGKTEAKIISKPDSASNDSVVPTQVIADVVPTPIVNMSSNSTSSISSAAINKNREQNQELMNSDKEPISTKKPNRTIIPPKIGLYNRTNYNLHVIFKNEDVLFPPRKRTEKIYKEADIVSVQGKSLQTAIATGLISLVR